MKKLFLVLFLLLTTANPVIAADSVKGIMTPPTKDVSLEYLGTIFGNVSPSLTNVGIHGNSQILGGMFEIFNQIALIVGITLIIYSVLVGTLNTATSGKILGEKWSAVWLPVRSAFGIALLVPTQTGYCIAQIVVMWIVYFGVGAAGTLWASAVNYLQMGHNIYSNQGVNANEKEGMTNAIGVSQAIFGSLACVNYHNTNDDLKNKSPYGFGKFITETGTRINFGYLEGDKGIGNECGYIQVNNPKQVSPVLHITSDLQHLFTRYQTVNDLSKYTDDVRVYLAMFNSNMQKTEDIIPYDNNWNKRKNTGWILAGNYYREISRFQTKDGIKVNYPNSGTSFEETLPECSLSANCRELIRKSRNDFANVAEKAKEIEYHTDNAEEAYVAKMEKPSKWSQGSTIGLSKAFESLAMPIMRAISGDFMSSGDPFASAVSTGKKMMEAAAGMVTLTLLIGNFVFGMIANICSAQNPTGGAAHTVQSIMSTLILGIAGFLYMQGAMLAIYLPLIPFIIFLIGTLGWFVSVVEAMIAAPLVAIGLIWPDAQNEVLGRAEPAMMMLLNLFLRPALMIMGLISGILLCWVGFKLTNLGFATMITTRSFSYEPMFGWLVIGFVYAMLLIAIAKKSFSLVHIIPDKVLTWIGDHSQGHGAPDEALGGLQGGYEKGGGAMSGFAGGVGSYVGYAKSDLTSGAYNVGSKAGSAMRNHGQGNAELTGKGENNGDQETEKQLATDVGKTALTGM